MQTRSLTSSKPCRQAGVASLPLLLLGLVILAVIGFVISSNSQVSDGPKPVVWDKTPCAFCAMHLGDRRFAAQLTTADSTTYFYDDPGCLFLHERQLDTADMAIHARWFHELEKDGWIEGGEVAFQRCENTPMDYGFGAVRRGSPASVSLEDAAAEVLAK